MDIIDVTYYSARGASHSIQLLGSMVQQQGTSWDFKGQLYLIQLLDIYISSCHIVQLNEHDGKHPLSMIK